VTVVNGAFHSIESAHEYLGLLGEALEEAQHTIQEDIDGLTPVGGEDTAELSPRTFCTFRRELSSL
jgi:hypothetical protein